MHRPESSAVILTSWRPDHVLAGASDLDVYELCGDRRWPLYTSDRLHAKLYSLDLTSAWIGSANVTRRALGLVEAGNDEVLGFVDPLPRDVQAWVFRLIHDSQPITEELHATYSAWLAEQPPVSKPPPVELSPVERDSFSVRELPVTNTPRRLWEVMRASREAEPHERFAADHDLAVYRVVVSSWDRIGSGDYNEFRQRLAIVFRAHPFVEALLAKVAAHSGPDIGERPGLQFGAVKEWVRETCTDEPVPNRRDLTDLVANLFAWCQELLPDVIEISRPVHTQVISLSS